MNTPDQVEFSLQRLATAEQANGAPHDVVYIGENLLISCSLTPSPAAVKNRLCKGSWHYSRSRTVATVLPWWQRYAVQYADFFTNRRLFGSEMRTDRRQFLGLCAVSISGIVTGCAEARSSDQSGGTVTDDSAGTATSTRVNTATSTPTETLSTDTSTPTEESTDTPTSTPTISPTGSTELTISNVGASAWEVTADESGGVAPTGEQNPTLTFTVGRRYRIKNAGWSAHPFALLADEGTALLSQDGSGTYESDQSVDWVDDGTQFEFTMTDSLAAEAAAYHCTIHASMRGDVEIA